MKKRRRHNKKGLPPGSLVYTGEQHEGKSISQIHVYTDEVCNVISSSTLQDAENLLASKAKFWLNIEGLNDTSLVEQIGKTFFIHPLVLEDILHTAQRPKIEDHGEYIYIVVRMISWNESNKKHQSEQLSFILTKNCVLTFQDLGGDVFDSVRTRLIGGKGRIRGFSVDYLLYSLLDSIIDNYFSVLEHLGDQIEELEENVTENPNKNTLHKLHALKRDMIFLRRSIWPLRDVIGSLERGGSPLLDEKTRIFMRDLYDHTIQVMDTIETYRDLLSGLLELYLSSISYKMNTVMKMLTIVATIFIPLTFVSSIYGMNFEYMPELKWEYGYPAIMIFMLGVALGMLVYFRKKDWL